MQIIVAGNRDYLKILCYAKHLKNTYFKLSHSVLLCKKENETLLCNTLTGELILLSDKEKEQLEHLPSTELFGLTDLKLHGFLTPQDHQEDQSVEQLCAIMLKRQEAKKTITHYNILPTTFCNARCFYCYESNIHHVHMSEETADKLIEFIAEHHGDAKVKLSWFGGEPMVGKARIDQICQGLTDRGIPFTSGMTSNGYLFDADVVQHAKEAWKMKSIQITLDGTEEIYNQTKAYVNVSVNPYHRVIQNIGYFADAGIHVDIRLNLDSHNAENLTELIEELSERFKNREYLAIYVSQLDEGAGFDPIEHSQSDLERLARQLIDLQELLESKGWPQFRETKLPSLRVTSCMADDPCTVQCTPDGIFSKCEDQIYNHTVGSLDEGITNKEEIKYWQQRRAFEGCAECPLYPSCIRLLKNCPVKTAKCTEYEKSRRIARYKEIMLEEYEKWKQSQASAEKT